MAAGRLFDKIAILGIIFALLLTVLFMNGEALGMQRIVSEDEVSLFTEDELNGSWDTSGATLITLTGDGANIDGNGAYVQDGDVIIYAAGSYVVEGTLDNGSVIVNETSKTKGKVWILLNGVEIHCEDSAAIDIEEATHVYLTLAEGTENTLSDGAAYSEDAVNANIRGALFSRDDLTINGSGSLTITGSYRHGIVCNDDLRITGGKITVTATEDGIHANESARFIGMTLEITAGDDGITVSNDDNEGELTVVSGSIRILSCAEGMESEKVTIDGGSIDINFTNDGINAGGTAPDLTINGGEIRLVSENGRDVDGLDSNADIEINGGTILISVNADGMNNAIDYGSETGGSCYINGGTVIAAGSSGMAEEMSESSAQGNVMYTLDETAEAGSTVRLTDVDGTVIFEAEIPCSFNELILSDPTIEAGGTYTLEAGEQSYEIEMTGTTVKYGTSGMNGGFGGPMGMGGHGGFGRRDETGTGEEPASSEDTAVREGFNGEMPKDMTPPEGFDGQVPESMTMPEGFDGEMSAMSETDKSDTEASGWEGRHGAGGFGGPRGQGGGPGMQDWEQAGSEDTMSAEDVKTALRITGLAAAVLLAGIFAAAHMKNRKSAF